MLVDRTQEAMLLQKRKRVWNPFYHLWTAWEHFAYFFAPANGCQYCWNLRLFLVGVLLGWHITYWWMK